MDNSIKLRSRRRIVWFTIFAALLIGVSANSLDYEAVSAIAFLAIFLGMFYVLLLGYYIRRSENTQANDESITKDNSTPPPYWKILAGNLLFGGFVLLLCSFNTLMANVSLLVVMGVLLPMALSAAKGMRELRRQRWTRFIIYALAVSVGWTMDHQANETEQRNYHDIIAAVEQYKAAEKRYPETLEQLVPKYLVAVPAGRWGKFMLGKSEADSAYLTHMPMPYVHESYSFKSRTSKTWD